MAAGLGFKTFTTGEVLSAANVNGYLMQGINVFASTAARDAAITSPQEGQFAFTKDTNGLWYYDGAAWVASGATGDIEGVSVTSPITGGGTSGTVTIGIDSTAVVPSQTGNSGKYLTTNGTASSWAAVAGGSLTLLSTTSLSGLACSGPSITGISGSYTNLLIVIVNAEKSGDHNVEFSWQTQNNHFITTYGTGASTGSLQSYSGVAGFVKPAGSSIVGSSANYTSAVIKINRYATTDTTKQFEFAGGFYNAGWAGNNAFSGGGRNLNSSAITSFQLRTEAQTGTWSGGTIYIYGEN
jgi:hypothetical protein